MRVSSTGYYHNSELRIDQRCVRSEQAQPGSTIADTGSGLAGHSLQRIVGSLSRTIVHRAHHAGHHALPGVGLDIYLMTNLGLEGRLFFTSTRDLRRKQFAAVSHG